MSKFEWQPIETAPKDKGQVLLYSAGWEMVTIGQRAAIPHENSWIDADPRQSVDEPTHWMPLPDAPELKGDKS